MFLSSPPLLLQLLFYFYIFPCLPEIIPQEAVREYMHSFLMQGLKLWFIFKINLEIKIKLFMSF